VKLYRMMKAAADGLPDPGEAFARLGVRPHQPPRRGDVRATDPADLVRPGDGGMSVAADSPNNLPARMRPPLAQYPVWEIDTADLGDGLMAQPAGPPHYHVEPAREMTLAELQALLAATRTRWVPVQWEVP
jgi:hypothetical protein